ncbi:RAB geranylgeranyl transferase alpha subunit 1 [Prunus dulcis]|uniref:RAB geranylgeranyl transferase alpha subunit 1 n=1 Tax=Prunus dulcis TaxID=3755 RepID=A0A4Y1QWA9_PRUDU|nr:RAB geranylgeranyl transferase alpha subunit 1 [Prunus dulcis]
MNKIGILTLARLLTAINLDPLHSQYYKDQHSLVFLQEVMLSSSHVVKHNPQSFMDATLLVDGAATCAPRVTSNRESLQRHCCSYKNLASASIGNYKCVRLNNISISRIGSIEKFLWVSMLDLSHNELCSIEGLEAMQLLSCLNLSVNKFSSFSALGPLRLLKSLKVLNISYNEIGLHTIDTTRYLCSSPLSHTEETSWNCDEMMPGVLRLMQLDIAGNAIAGENFKSFLVKVVPSLQWLDVKMGFCVFMICRASEYEKASHY